MLAGLLLHLPGDRAETAREIAARLRLSLDEGHHIFATVRGFEAFTRLASAGPDRAPDRRAIYLYFKTHGRSGVDGLLLGLASYLAGFQGPPPSEDWNLWLDAASTLLRAYFETPKVAVRPAPLLNGDDLMRELGLPAGPQLGRLLEAVYEAQAAGEVADRQAALAFVRLRAAQG
jgi:hypothetical protein